MLREIEFSSAELRSVLVNTRQGSITWTLPASKTDSSALGETVAHGCCCPENDRRGGNPLCPYHLMREHLSAYRLKFPHRFHASGEARAGFPLFPDGSGEVCTKEGVTNTIRAAAKFLGHALVDPGGLFLDSGHALRVTGAQGLARAGLSENTIALLARWGSAAVRTYIRKAPLAASHCLAAVALAGWERNAATRPTARFPLTAVRTAPQVQQNGGSTLMRTKAKAKAKASRCAGALRRQAVRLTTAERGILALQEWRAAVTHAPPLPPTPVVIDPEAVVPRSWSEITSSFAYVISIRGKCHKVEVGYPAHPRDWKSKCGWPFGFSDVAVPVQKIPACHKLICARCLPRQGGATRIDSESKVLEVGG